MSTLERLPGTWPPRPAPPPLHFQHLARSAPACRLLPRACRFPHTLARMPHCPVQPLPSHLPACARYQSLSGLGGTSARTPGKALGWDSLGSTVLAERLLRATGKPWGCSMQRDRPRAMFHVIGKAGLGVRPGQAWLGHRMLCLPGIGSLVPEPTKPASHSCEGPKGDDAEEILCHL